MNKLKFWQRIILFFKIPRIDIEGSEEIKYKRWGERIYIISKASLYQREYGDSGYSGWCYYGKGNWLFSINEGALLKYPSLSIEFKWLVVPIFFYLRIYKFRLSL
ncbi:MAG TPA: hypothetical protein ENH82_17520 [bacterium]|nr:hypothetical protein [bacterium]